jgi:hypothetical protein
VANSVVLKGQASTFNGHFMSHKMSRTSQLQKLAIFLEDQGQASTFGRRFWPFLTTFYTYDECTRNCWASTLILGFRLSYVAVCLLLTAANNQNPPHLGACQHPNNDDVYPDSDNCSTATTINNAQKRRAGTMGRGKQCISVEKKKTASLDFHQYCN